MNIFRLNKRGWVLIDDSEVTEPAHQNEPVYIFLFPLIGISILITAVFMFGSLPVKQKENFNLIRQGSQDKQLNPPVENPDGSKPAQPESKTFIYPLQTGWPTYIGEGITLYYPLTYSVKEMVSFPAAESNTKAILVQDEAIRNILSVFSCPASPDEPDNLIRVLAACLDIKPDDKDRLKTELIADELILNKRQFSSWKVRFPAGISESLKGDFVAYILQNTDTITFFLYDKDYEAETDTLFRILTMIATSQENKRLN